MKDIIAVITTRLFLTITRHHTLTTRQTRNEHAAHITNLNRDVLPTQEVIARTTLRR